MAVNLEEIYPKGIPEWRLREIKHKQEKIEEAFDAQLFCVSEIDNA